MKTINHLKCKLCAMLSIAYALSFAITTEARLNFNDIKRYFKQVDYSKENAHAKDLLWGYTGINSGFVENLRLYFGGFDFKYNKDDKRTYQEDEGSQNADPLDKNFADILSILFPSTAGLLATDVNHARSISSLMTPEVIAKLCSSTIDKTKVDFSMITKEQFDDQNPKHVSAQKLVDSMNPIISNENNKKSFADSKLLNLIFLSYAYEKFNSFEEAMKFGKTLNVLAEDSYNFNPKDWSLYKIYYEFYDSTKKYNNEYYLAGLSAIYRYEYLRINSVTPYDSEAPINNGLACVIDDKGIASETETIADCQETTVRVLMNLIFFSADTKEFVLPDSISNKKLIDFYKIQNASMANNGSEKIRTEWNKVVSNLSEVDYVGKNKNELLPGFINLIKTICKITGEKIPDKLTRKKENEEKTIEVLKSLLEKLFNQKKEISINGSLYFGENYNGKDCDFFGDLLIEVEDKTDSKMNFSFTISQARVHGQINKNVNETSLDYEDTFELKNDNIIDSNLRNWFTLSFSGNNRMYILGSKNIIYKLYGYSKLNSFEKLIENIFLFGKMKKKNKYNLNFLNVSISEILNKIDLNDYNTLNYIKEFNTESLSFIDCISGANFRNLHIDSFLIYNGSSTTFITKEQVEGLVANLTNIRKAKINFDSFGDEAYEVLAKFFEKQDSIVTIDIYFSYDEKNVSCESLENLFVSALKNNERLEVINLTIPDISIDIKKIISAINSKKLKFLDINKNFFYKKTREDYVEIRESILKTLKSNRKNIRSIRLKNLQITPIYAKKISTELQKCEKLSNLELYNANIQSEGAKSILKSLENLKNLESLELNECNIGSDAVQCITELIKKNLSLKEIDLSHNNINAQGIDNILKAMQDNTSIKSLDLSFNDLLSQNIKSFMELLKTNKSLERIGLKNDFNAKNKITIDDFFVLAQYIHKNEITSIKKIENSIERKSLWEHKFGDFLDYNPKIRGLFFPF